MDWSNVRKDTFASSSWDGNVKLVRIFLEVSSSCTIDSLLSGDRIIRDLLER